ncbi:TrkH family potassium uptake protein [Isoptericola variabilis]|uniref:H(+)-transporting two-sector ATPase n=1 Tax=Isoptericola variabilis (strain 225) TaxID=743718 RepID=F6FVZ0_ISOV2|nr:potassium transporter TrkG [Isoptericola variabilis]AEG44460.1 H(+)-transporting two-sector ATPase [Isoptericola variabilis 225]TWH28266.1 potassium uptake TrkH family protein [Isoptericola variabilis J7]
MRFPRPQPDVVRHDGRPTPRASGPSPASLRRRPAQLVTLGFVGAIAVGTLLLSLPVASTGRRATFVEALFTTTSAVCVTGLVVVDTETFWTPFGQVVILALIQVGGFGVMTVASLLGVLLTRRLGLSTRLVAAESTHTVGLGDVRRVLLGALRLTVVAEALVASVVAARLMVSYDESPAHAAWSGAFHAVSAFNNAGFSLYSDSLVRFVADPWVCLPICAAVIVGGLGFPVLLELWRLHRSGDGHLLRPRWWSIHSRITVGTTAVLLTVGTLVFLLAEWGNPRTFGPLDVPGKLLAAFTQAVMPRTAGFNSVPTSELNNGTWFFTDILMFIGAGSAGTGGGIKVGTFAALAFVIWSELRGDPDVEVFDRRLAVTTQRQALTVALLGVAAVVVPTFVMTVTTTTFALDAILFEVVSAFSTTGLSTGITASLPAWDQLILVVLMFVGRLGPITLGTSLALRERRRLYRRPESAMIIG